LLAMIGLFLFLSTIINTAIDAWRKSSAAH
jgi:hypothetical protein